MYDTTLDSLPTPHWIEMSHAAAAKAPFRFETMLCIPSDQADYVPRRMKAPPVMPAGAPIPRIGDVVYLSRTSAWGVKMVVHEWQAGNLLRIEVWIVHLTSSARPDGFALTQ